MFAKHNFPFQFIISLLLSKSIWAQEKINIEWTEIAHLPRITEQFENPGIAGAFSGIHNNVLLVAGGANFPEAMPWEGGKKIYWDDIYVLEKENSNEYDWVKTGYFRLPQRVAYGASISTPDGVLCLGGENEKGILKSVFLLQWNASEKLISIKHFPDLPVPLTNASASIHEQVVYLSGGETPAGVSDKFYSLDLNNISVGWKSLPPLPKPLSHAVSVAQSNGGNKYIYILGGRQKKANGISDFYDSVFKYDILNNKWTQQKPLPYALAAGTGIAVGDSQVIMFGGDKGKTFHKTELLLAAIAREKNERKKEKLVRKKNNLQESHPGFSRDIFLFNTIKNEWKLIGKMTFPAPVTTTAIKWGNRVFIPSGEIKAGVRTASVWMGILNFKEP